MSLRAKYLMLKEIVTLMGLFEYLGLGGGLYFAGARQFQESAVFFTLMGISYYTSTKVAYKVQEMLVQIYSKGG